MALNAILRYYFITVPILSISVQSDAGSSTAEQATNASPANQVNIWLSILIVYNYIDS